MAVYLVCVAGIGGPLIYRDNVIGVAGWVWLGALSVPVIALNVFDWIHLRRTRR